MTLRSRSDRQAVAVDCSAPARSPCGNCTWPTFSIGYRQIALPFGFSRIDLRQPLADGEAVAVGLQRACKVSLSHLHVADPRVRHREIALPFGFRRVVFRQPLADGEAVVADASAPARSPCPPSTSPIFTCETARSARLQELAGLLTSRSTKICRACWAAERTRRVADRQ